MPLPKNEYDEQMNARAEFELAQEAEQHDAERCWAEQSIIKLEQGTHELKPDDNYKLWINHAKGTLPLDDLRRAFVMGAKWWEFQKEGATMWNSDRHLAEQAAEEYFPGGKLPEKSDKFELKPCKKCLQMTNHIGMVCQKCGIDWGFIR